MMNLKNIRTVFDNYVNGFDVKEYRINLKKEHTYRVVNFAKDIAKNLQLSKEQTLLAMTIAYLHDLGRFEQWTQYKTFVDKLSFDHGDFANKLLFEEGFIEKFGVDKKHYKTIYFAVKFHNKYEIDLNEIKTHCLKNENENWENIIMHCKIIRDADKLDIFKQIAEFIIPIKPKVNESTGLTPAVYNNFSKKLLVNNKDLKSTLDKAVLQLAMAYDLNYAYSKQVFIKRNFTQGVVKGYENALNDEDYATLSKLAADFQF